MLKKFWVHFEKIRQLSVFVKFTFFQKTLIYLETWNLLKIRIFMILHLKDLANPLVVTVFQPGVKMMIFLKYSHHFHEKYENSSNWKMQNSICIKIMFSQSSASCRGWKIKFFCFFHEKVEILWKFTKLLKILEISINCMKNQVFAPRAENTPYAQGFY